MGERFIAGLSTKERERAAIYQACIMQRAKQLLKNVFGYQEFRPLQEACIRSVLQKRDTLLIMPTGGGKSICYQIPALIFEGLTVVVSPLISLMKDQVSQLRAAGVATTLLNSSLSQNEYAANITLVKSGGVRILFLAPETLIKQDIMELLTSVNVDCLTIDEAHCISEWGHDFRPEYRQLFGARSRFSKAVCLAMTATATPRVRKDIRDNLKIEAMNEFVASFNRPNLFYEVIPKADPLNQTINFLKRFPKQSGIIYCFSRRRVDELSAKLEQEGFSVKPYHAGLPVEARTRNQELFIRDDAQIMVATLAFGMGIHKSNVRFVVHYDLPKNIESYYQETGRAGRDGLSAHCLLLFGYGDIRNIRFFVDQKTDEAEKRMAAFHLNSMIHYAEAEVCRRRPLITYFSEEYHEEKCGMCDNCVNPKTPTFDMTEAARKFLSCVDQTGQRFGARHLIDILKGSSSEKVIRFGHHGLAVYGMGKEYSMKQWLSLVRQFIQKGVAWQDQEAYGALKITPHGREVLKGSASILGFVPATETKTKRVIGETPHDHGEDEELFEILRLKRKELADQANVPSYIIFSDKSLLEMSRYRPQSKESFSTIYGVGTKKLESYGDIFVKLIRRHCDARGPA